MTSSDRTSIRKAAVSFELAVLLLALFVALGSATIAGETLAADRTIILLVNAWTSPSLTTAMRAFTDLGSGYVIGPVCVVESIIYYRIGDPFPAAVLVLAVGSGVLLAPELKLVFMRPRPEVVPHLVAATGLSYPSGHTTLATVTYGFSAVMAVPRFSRRSAKLAIALGATALVLLVAVSRVYLGVHYPTDVLGGLLLGSALAAFWWGVLQMLRAHRPVPPAPRCASLPCGRASNLQSASEDAPIQLKNRFVWSREVRLC